MFGWTLDSRNLVDSSNRRHDHIVSMDAVPSLVGMHHSGPARGSSLWDNHGGVWNGAALHVRAPSVIESVVGVNSVRVPVTTLIWLHVPGDNSRVHKPRGFNWPIEQLHSNSRNRNQFRQINKNQCPNRKTKEKSMANGARQLQRNLLTASTSVMVIIFATQTQIRIKLLRESIALTLSHSSVEMLAITRTTKWEQFGKECDCTEGSGMLNNSETAAETAGSQGII